MPAYRIRLGQRRDLEPLLALFDLVAEERIYIGAEPGYDRELYRHRFSRMIAHPEQSPVFVAETQGELVGQLGIFTHEEFGPMLGMMVAPAWRGRGVGTALLDAAFTWARTARLRALSLLVFTHNGRAIGLYRAMGFAEVERYERDVTRRNGEVWDTMLMRKDFP
ncbi:MAG TPA: GNAT family N-acetyltransferase [Candidatus Baltobacteraceae bacterium]|nr:GNAT family N-acetyltransferase [Candidatus Baltobacteraceae bacterium]